MMGLFTGVAESRCRMSRRRVGWVLTGFFVLALVMGPGPGLYLVNPDPSDPASFRTVLGLPIIYAWGLLWFTVQASVLIVAYFTVWNDEETRE